MATVSTLAVANLAGLDQAAPPSTVPASPQVVGGVTSDDLERLADTLDRLADAEGLTPEQADAIRQADELVDAINDGAVPIVPDTAPPPTTAPAAATLPVTQAQAPPATPPADREPVSVDEVTALLRDQFDLPAPTTTVP